MVQSRTKPLSFPLTERIVQFFLPVTKITLDFPIWTTVWIEKKFATETKSTCANGQDETYPGNQMKKLVSMIAHFGPHLRVKVVNTFISGSFPGSLHPTASKCVHFSLTFTLHFGPEGCRVTFALRCQKVTSDQKGGLIFSQGVFLLFRWDDCW